MSEDYIQILSFKTGKISVFLALGLELSIGTSYIRRKKTDVCWPFMFIQVFFFQQLMKYVCFLQVVTLQEAKLLLKEDDDLIIAVYDYWLNKRLRLVSS